jgi:hypothetical protein
LGYLLRLGKVPEILWEMVTSFEFGLLLANLNYFSLLSWKRVIYRGISLNVTEIQKVSHISE